MASRYAEDGDAGGKSDDGKYHVQIELLSWTVVEDLSSTTSSGRKNEEEEKSFFVVS